MMAAGDIVMSYQNMVLLQMWAQLLFTVCLFGGIAFLLVGLVRSRWVGMRSRWRVFFATLGIWIFGAVAWGGAIGFTHSQPNGPHAFESYMDGVTARACVSDATANGCAALRQKCETRDPTHPACRILAGEDPAKFYRTTVRN